MQRPRAMRAFLATLSVLGCASATTRSPASDPQAATAVISSPVVSLYSRIPTEVEAFKLTERASVTGQRTDSLFRYRDGSRTVLTLFIYDISADVRVDPDSQKW